MLAPWVIAAMHQRALDTAVSERAPARAPNGYDVPKVHWDAFLRRFVERHGGATCHVGLDRRRQPLHGARIAKRVDGSSEVLITLGEPPYMLECYSVVEPARIRVEPRRSHGLALRIEGSDDTTLILGFEQVGRTSGPLTLLA